MSAKFLDAFHRFYEFDVRGQGRKTGYDKDAFEVDPTQPAFTRRRELFVVSFSTASETEAALRLRLTPIYLRSPQPWMQLISREANS